MNPGLTGRFFLIIFSGTISQCRNNKAAVTLQSFKKGFSNYTHFLKSFLGVFRMPKFAVISKERTMSKYYLRELTKQTI